MISRRKRPAATPAQHSPSPDSPPDIPEWLEHVRATVEGEAPLMRTLMIRAINAVLKFDALSEDAAAQATAAPTDLSVLMRVLASGELLEDLRAVEPLAPAFIRGIQAKRRLIEEHGGTVTAEDAAELLGVTRQAIDKRRRSGKLIALSTGRHGYRYPAWQFASSGILPGLERVLEILSPHDEWMQTAFFVNNNVRLGNRTPIEMLRLGKLELVLRAAEAYGEHGAA